MKYLTFLLIAFISCKKSSSNLTSVTGKVIDASSIGCGWQILINDTEYCNPDYLPDNVKQNNLTVLVDYANTKDTAYCGDPAALPYKVIHIISIQPK